MSLLTLLFTGVSVFASPCTTGSLAAYAALDDVGCDIGNFKFSHFDWAVITSINAQPAGPSNITVTPSIGPDGSPKVDFTANWGTLNNTLVSNYTATIGFRVETEFPFDRILTGNVLDIFGTATGLTPLATVAEVNCLGGLLAPTGIACLSGGINAGATATLGLGANVAANAALLYNPPVQLVDVIKNITLTSAGTVLLPGTASLSEISQTFSTTGNAPEPSTWVTLGSALVGLGLLQIRKR